MTTQLELFWTQGDRGDREIGREERGSAMESVQISGHELPAELEPQPIESWIARKPRILEGKEGGGHDDAA